MRSTCGALAGLLCQGSAGGEPRGARTAPRVLSSLDNMAWRPAPEQLSPKAMVALLPETERAQWLSQQDLRALQRSWRWHARPAQRGPEFRTETELPRWAHSLVLTPEQI